MLGRLVLAAVLVGTQVPAKAAAQTTQPALMPAVVDSSIAVARRLIGEHRLHIKAIPIAGPPDRALLVFAQNPQPGTVITADSVATIWVSVISTRDLSNVSEQEADSILRYAGLAPGARVQRRDTAARLAVIRRITNEPKPSRAVAVSAGSKKVVSKPKPKPAALPPRARAGPESEPEGTLVIRDTTPPDTAALQADTATVLATLPRRAPSQIEREQSATLWPWLMVALGVVSLGVAAFIRKFRRERTLAAQLAAHNESLATIHYVIRSDGTPIFRDTHEIVPLQEERAAD